MRIAVDELRRIADQLLTHVESRAGRQIELEADFYWNVPDAVKYDQYEEPKELDVGQLSEDWDRLAAISRGDSPPVGAALAWLGELFKAVAKQTP